jgi:hypothetical protein
MGKALVKLHDDNCWFGYFGPIKIRIKDDDTNQCTIQWGYGEFTSPEQEVCDSWADEMAILADILKKHREIKNMKRALFMNGKEEGGNVF